jgi:hypothetical protein
MHQRPPIVFALPDLAVWDGIKHRVRNWRRANRIPWDTHVECGSVTFDRTLIKADGRVKGRKPFLIGAKGSPKEREALVEMEKRADSEIERQWVTSLQFSTTGSFNFCAIRVFRV